MTCRDCDHVLVGWQKHCPECGAPVAIRHGGGGAAVLDRSPDRPTLGVPRTRRVAMVVRASEPRAAAPGSAGPRVAMISHAQDAVDPGRSRWMQRALRSRPLRFAAFAVIMLGLLILIEWLRHIDVHTS